MTNRHFFSEQSIQRQLTIGIKTFHRPQCLLHCVASIRKQFKNIVILIADDSDDAMKQKNIEVLRSFQDVTIISLPFNSGLSFGRNQIVKQTNTPYFLTLDDDNFISEKTKILESLAFLEHYRDFDLLAGICPERGKLYGEKSASYSMCFSRFLHQDGQRTIRTNPNFLRINNPYLFRTFKTDITLNLFIARTAVLKLFPWNENKKLGEHEDFFVALYESQINCAISYDTIFGEILDQRRKYEYKFPGNNIHNTYSREYDLQI